ncbi:DUF917 domain-containing protein [Microbacterium paludicola]|uniref:DUF917 domain-containing protein n=1 Tax=Microbacterium paludicola TaxID=300019 RepID=A0A4Y9FTC8_9MICO|nr:DUF917 domain-containing protein [Microbacterium paludicola]MBF0817187.1 DUF917 domain-containing protein [Microbacterium paludicola]TFU32114.1 DUF917 domain-containing protein [Microbacterium paludicola]
MTVQITREQLKPLAAGAAILGCGGGGDPYIGRLVAEAAIDAHGPVALVDLDDVPDDASVFPVAGMGAPTVGIEKLAATGQAVSAVQLLAKHLGRPIDYITCGEVGGGNSMVPIAVAAELGVPLINGDGMGRAFPELQMGLAPMIGVSATPMSVTDEKGNRAILETISSRWAEWLARDVTIEMGTSSTISLYPMTGEQAKRAHVRGSLSLCTLLGELVDSTRAAHGDIGAALAEELRGVRLLGGKVADVERRTQTGFARGNARIVADGGSCEELVISFQNEYLLAELDGRAVAATPDLIMLIESDTGTAITGESLRYGQRVTALAAPADARWYSPEGLELVGPEYFGYDAEPTMAGAAR